MKSKKTILAAQMFIFFEIILIIMVIISFATKQWENLFLSLLAILSLSFPFIITHIAAKKRVMLPPRFQLVAVLFI
jgi:putative membrane protein